MQIDSSNGIETPVLGTLADALVIIAELKAKLASHLTENSSYNLGRNAGYNERYLDGKATGMSVPRPRGPRKPRVMPTK